MVKAAGVIACCSPRAIAEASLTGPSLRAGFRLTRDHSVRFPDRAPFVTGSLQAFVGDFRPKLFQRPRRGLVRVPFGVIRSPRHLLSVPIVAGVVGDYAS